MPDRDDNLSAVWRKVRGQDDTLRDHNDRLDDVERAVSKMVDELKPVLTDYAYAKRRREDRRLFWRDWRVIVAAIGGALVVVESALQIVKAIH